MIQNGSKVRVNYTGKLENGDVFDSSLTDGRSPLEFIVGNGQLIPGFERGIMGLNVGDTTTVHIQSQDGYGSIREDLVISVPKDNVPSGVQVGQSLQTQTEDGQTIIFEVKQVNDNEVIVDANHPLAGKN